MFIHKALRDNIAKGLYIQNLDSMILICQNAFQQKETALPYFLIEKIFATIRREWEEEPITVEETERVEKVIIPLILKVLDCMENEEENSKLFQALNNLVIKFKTLKI
ncbi:MAG: hypothetical protein ACYDIA_20660 [Candidatus Humimicrobiaceae bacterium]